MRYAFIAEHRDRFGVRAMCRCLAVQPSGYYAWQKSPLSQRAREDARQTDLIRKAWNDSGKVYPGLFIGFGQKGWREWFKRLLSCRKMGV